MSALLRASKGEFDADLTLVGINPALAAGSAKSVPVLASARIKGPVNGGTWTVTGDVRSVSPSTAATGWEGANISGNLNSFSVHSGLASDITAGSIKSTEKKSKRASLPGTQSGFS